MNTIQDLEFADLRVVRDDTGALVSVIDGSGRDLGFVASKRDPLTGGISLDGIPILGGTGVSLVAALGDSITAYSTIGSSQSNFAGYNAFGFLTWAMAYSMGALWMPKICKYNVTGALVDYNRGVSGERAEQTLARVSELDALPVKPKFCSILVGTNNLTVIPAQSATQIVSSIIAIVNEVKSRGITPVLCTLLPRGNGTSAGWGALTAPQIATARGTLMEVNRQLRAYSEVENVILADTFFSAMNNWASATSDPLAAMTGAGTGAADYIHPNTPGSMAIGSVWWQAVSPYCAPAPRNMAGGGDTYDATNNVYGSVVDSSWATGGGTAGTGVTAGANGIPSGWTANRLSGATSTAVFNRQARADGKSGNECVATMTGLDTSVFRMYQGGSTLADFPIPSYIMAEVEVSLNTGAAVSNGVPDIFIRSNSGGYQILGAQPLSSGDPVGTHHYLLRTPIVLTDTGQTSWAMWTTSGTKAGGTGDVVATFRNMRCGQYNTAMIGGI